MAKTVLGNGGSCGAQQKLERSGDARELTRDSLRNELKVSQDRLILGRTQRGRKKEDVRKCKWGKDRNLKEKILLKAGCVSSRKVSLCACPHEAYRVAFLWCICRVYDLVLSPAGTEIRLPVCSQYSLKSQFS